MPKTDNKNHILKTALTAFMRQTKLVCIRNYDRKGTAKYESRVL